MEPDAGAASSPSTGTSGKKALNLLDLNLAFDVRPEDLPKGKVACRKCNKRVHLLCPDCLLISGIEPDPEAVRVKSKLPLKVHVWRSSQEARHGKTTSVHIPALLKEGDAEIISLESLPTYEEDPAGVLILFPSAVSVPASALPDLSRFHTLCVVDCSWGKTGGVVQKLERDTKEGKPAASFTHVHISAYETLFWRYQSLGAHCLSTVESVYFFLREFLVEKAKREATAIAAQPSSSSSAPPSSAAAAAAGNSEDHASDPCDSQRRYYDGSLDNLVLLFVEQYQTIQKHYVETQKEFTRKHRPGYIKGSSTAASEVSSSAAGDADQSTGASLQLPLKRSHAEAEAERAIAGAGAVTGDDGDSSDENAAGKASAGQKKRTRPPKGAAFVRVDLLDAAAAQKLRRAGDGSSVLQSHQAIPSSSSSSSSSSSFSSVASNDGFVAGLTSSSALGPAGTAAATVTAASNASSATAASTDDA